jgi:hypothetical protein
MDKIHIVPKEDHPYLKYILWASMGVSLLLVLYFWMMFLFTGLSPLLHGVYVTLGILVLLVLIYVYKLHPEFILDTRSLIIKKAFRQAIEYDLREIRSEIIIIEKPTKYQVIFSTVLDQKIKVTLTKEHIKTLEQMGFKLVSIGVKYQ